jgi:tRNA pseudouridine38-40 synthase
MAVDVRIAICVEYDGAAFQGWQSQTHGQTIQDNLERALSSVAGDRLHTVAAGRTDAGVHALAQIAHFDTLADRKPQAWVRGSNALLPPTICVRWATAVDDEFHARFSAVSRRYRYVLFNHPVRPAIQSGRVGWYHRPLDVALMQTAARCLIGEQDFSSFRSAECQAKTPVKRMHRADVARAGDYLIFDFQANGFLQHMVRNIVGALVWVGSGKQAPAWLGEVLSARDRTHSAPTFAPDGLYFAGVDYDARWRLPADERIIAFSFPATP